MKAPEKIYMANVDENPKFLDRTWYYVKQVGCYNIEYTRTDTFIEKVCSGIEKLLSGHIIRNFHFGDSYDIDRLIEDFKNYMKGE